MTLEELGKVIARDPPSVDRFIALFSPWMMAVVRALLARCTWTRWGDEDLLHEVIIAMFTKDAAVLRSWDPDGGRSLKNYLCKFTQFRVIERLKSRSGESPTNDADLVGHLERRASVPSPSGDRVDAMQALEWYRTSECPAGQWPFFESYLDGASPEELMREFNLSRNAVDKRLSRMRAALRRMLGADD